MKKDKPLILIVEDDPEVRRLLEMLLTRADFATLTAKDGAEALQALSSHTDIDAVLLDWMLPVMDGMDVLKEMKANGDTTPVLMATAKTARQDIMEALNAGAVDYICKPIQREELSFKLNNILKLDREKAKRHAALRKHINLNATVPFVVTEVSDEKCRLEATFPVEPESVITIQSDEIATRLDLPRDHNFALRVIACEGNGNRYCFEAAFTGLTPALKRKLRAVRQSGGWSL